MASANAIDLLTAQHRDIDIDDLFVRIAGETGERTPLFIELADKLAAPATIEAMVSYPAVMSARTSAPLAEAVEEHVERNLTHETGTAASLLAVA